MLVGTAWYAKKPVTTCLNQCPCSGIEWCRRCRISSLISLSFARMRSERRHRGLARWLVTVHRPAAIASAERQVLKDVVEAERGASPCAGS